MNKYKVEFVQTETFIVDVKAENEKQAIEKAEKSFEAIENLRWKKLSARKMK